MSRPLLAFAVAATLACASQVFTTQAADARILITIDKSTQEMTVEVDGATRWQWPVSTGRRGHATPSGSYTAFRMEADHYSKEFDDAPMPHSIFFTRRGHAIHGSFETRRLGTAASHGCVRLHPANAARLMPWSRSAASPPPPWWYRRRAAGAVARPAPRQVAPPPEEPDPRLYQPQPGYRGFPGLRPAACVRVRRAELLRSVSAGRLRRILRPLVNARQACLRLSGTLPPPSASLVITCRCNQMFIAAEPSSAPE